MSVRDRADALAEVAERVALLNEFRTDDFQDSLYDALVAMGDVAESSPIRVRDTCADALREAGPATAER